MEGVSSFSSIVMSSNKVVCEEIGLSNGKPKVAKVTDLFVLGAEPT